MKIIIVNYRYFISGGPERYLFNVTKLLESNGHEVIPFSVKHKLNVYSKYEHYFLESFGSSDEVYSKDFKKNKIKLFFKVLTRFFYSLEAKHKFSYLIQIEKPDVIYVLHYKGLISPSIFDTAKKHNIPIIQRISDFNRICANNVLFDYKQNQICEKCITGTKLNGIIGRCSNGSLVNSIIKVFALYVEDMMHLSTKIDAYVVPSEFTISKLASAGIQIDKMNFIPTFFSGIENYKSNEITNDNFILYFGRVDADKGIEFLIETFKSLNLQLVIIGESISAEYYARMNQLIVGHENISLIGKKTFGEIAEYLRKCSFVVVPSLWYDNFPNVVLEAYYFKKPVIASRIGSLQNMVEDNVTGLLFERNNKEDFIKKVNYLYKNQPEITRMGRNALTRLKDKYNPESHYNSLIELFSRMIKSK
jgi:glycosyltransferase involved in cell wall biosynthesis